MPNDMKEFLQAEKARLQAQFNLLNTRGSWMEIKGDDGKVFIKTLVDSYTVTRIAPSFDPQGNLNKTDFWLLWKSAGYNNGFQYSHTIKVVKVFVDDTLDDTFQGRQIKAWIVADLTDDRQRLHHIELIEPTQDREYAQDWCEWQSFKVDNAERFARIDAEILKEHLKIAEEWQ